MNRFITTFILMLLLITQFTPILGQRLEELKEGNPPIAPRWVFEPWVWEDNGNTAGSTMELVTGYRDHNIPVGAIIIDSPWSTAYNSFEWDTIRYGNPQGMIDNLHEQGIRVIIWMTAMYNKTARDVPKAKSEHYDWLIEQGYVVNDGRPDRWWKGTGVHIDFNNPDAVEWFHGQMDKMLDMGIDGWKTDAGANHVTEPVSTATGDISRKDLRWLYYGDVYDYTVKRNPEGIILARPYSHQGDMFASPPSKCVVGWCGDFLGNWDGLQLQMEDMYKSANAGYGAIACEVGGFVHRARSNKEQLIRYAQYGALSPVMINGGHNGGLTNHLPWYHDDETVKLYRYYATLHSELAPYIFSYSVEANLTGKPIMRNANIEQRQHHLGEELFVSPVVTEDLYKQVYFPEDGYWIDYWNEDMVFSPDSEEIVSCPIGEIPLYIKAGAIIPMNVKNKVTHHGDAFSKGKQTILIYPYENSSFTFHKPVGEGVDYTDVEIDVDEKNGEITVDGENQENYRLRIKSFSKPEAVENADSWKYCEKMKYVIIDKKGDRFTVKIDGLDGYGEKINAL